MINVILQFLELDLVNINVSAKFYQNIPNGLRVTFHCFQNLNLGKTSTNLMGYIMSISMCMQNFITIFHSVQEIGPFSLFQNLELGKASTDEKCHFAISWARFFQNLNLGNASANPKWHLTIPWATSCQYQCRCKILSKYPVRFKSYRHFSRTGRRQNLHK